MSANAERNLGYFAGFMRAYGRADYPTRAALYADTQAYQYGRESADALYGQVASLLGLAVTSPQVYSPARGAAVV